MTQKILLAPSEMPRQWYNAVPDIPGKLDPPLNPATGKPVGPEALTPIFPMSLIEQEVSAKSWIDIPEEVSRILALWRPTPLARAERLEKLVGARARIYYKNESVSPAGSHKPNTAVAQAYYNKQAGIQRLVTETGAGQWGSSLAFATRLFDLECLIYMVRCSYEQKPSRRSMIHTWGAEVIRDLPACPPSP